MTGREKALPIEEMHLAVPRRVLCNVLPTGAHPAMQTNYEGSSLEEPKLSNFEQISGPRPWTIKVRGFLPRAFYLFQASTDVWAR